MFNFKSRASSLKIKFLFCFQVYDDMLFIFNKNLIFLEKEDKCILRNNILQFYVENIFRYLFSYNNYKKKKVFSI